MLALKQMKNIMQFLACYFNIAITQAIAITYYSNNFHITIDIFIEILMVAMPITNEFYYSLACACARVCVRVNCNFNN